MSAIYPRSTAAWCVSLKGIVPGLLVTLTLFTSACLLVPQATKASGVVTNCTEAALRAALAGGGTVTFACEGVIVLSSSILILSNTVLDGGGRAVTIDGNNAVNVFNVRGFSLTLSNLTIAHGMNGIELGWISSFVRVVNCTFINNTSAVGGAIFLTGGTSLEALNSTFSANRAVSGGAVRNWGAAVVRGCTFVGNHADAIGAALENYSSMQALNCTFFGNTTGNRGSAIYNDASLIVRNCTFVDNSPLEKTIDDIAGGLVQNCIITSLSGSATIDANHNLRGAKENLLLGPLADNGGPTRTMALLPGSPAIDAADASVCLLLDQRGFSRSCGNACDIGAFEFSVRPSGVVRFGLASFSIRENGSFVPILVARDCGSVGDITVELFTRAGTASAGTDFAATNVTLTFSNGITDLVVSVPVLDDVVIEGNETFSLVLSNATGGAMLGDPTNATVTILEDDAFGQFSFSAPAFRVMEDAGQAVLTVQRTAGSLGTVTVDFETSDLTAIAAMDYTSVAGRLSFSPDQLTAQIVVPILDNSGYSGNRSFRTQLKNAQGGATLATPATAEVTIVDNESSLRLTSTTYEIPEGGPNALVTVTRVGWLSNSVSISYATQDGTAISGADYVSVSGTLVFGIGESNGTVLVPIIDDTEIEPHETILLTLFNPSGGALLGSPSSANLLIRENDAVLTCDEAGLRTALANGGTVKFACDGVISLSNPIRITNDTVLDANLHGVTLSGNGRTRVFEVSPGATLTLVGLRITSGWASTSVEQISAGFWRYSAFGVGGGIANTGTVQAINCSFEGNLVSGWNGYYPATSGTEGCGGAVFNAGTFLATNSSFSGNSAIGGSGGQDWIALPGAAGAGGAIYSIGPAVLVGCTFITNVARGGAGASGGIIFSLPSPTGAAGGSGQGGAIYNGGPLHIDRCLFVGNQASGGNGGGASGTDGSDNGGTGGAGGSGQGGAAFAASAELVVSASTFARNSAFGGASTAGTDGRTRSATPGLGGFGGSGGSALGGAIFVAGGFVALTNNTIAENSCSGSNGSKGGNGGSCLRIAGVSGGAPGGNGGAGGNARGVGLCMTGGQGECVNNTIASNRGTNGTPEAGGIGGAPCWPANAGTNGVAGAPGRVIGENLSVTNGSLTLRNTLIAYSVAGQNCAGTVVDGGHNLSSDGSCGFTAAGSVNNVDPGLGPFRSNGGLTPTMALAPDSPAIDAGNNAACPPVDQRGMPRPAGAACDIGAFEGSDGIHHPGLRLSFTPAVIRAGGVSTMQFILTNQDLLPLTSLSFTEFLPPGFTIAGPDSFGNGCGGSVLTFPSNVVVSLALASLPPKGSCWVVVDVTSSTPGAYTNGVISISSSQTGTGAAQPHASITVMGLPVAITGLPDGSVPPTTTSGVVIASIIPKGAPTLAWVEYGSTTNYDRRTPMQDAGSGFDPVQLVHLLDGLSPASMHHYRAVASNIMGMAFGMDRTFWTLPVFSFGAGYALRLDGTNDFIFTTNLTRWFTNETVTIELWFSADGPGILVDERGQPPETAGWQDSQMEILPTGELVVRVWNLPRVSLGTVVFGKWHHAVLRYDRETQTLDGFLDGVEAATDTHGNRSAPWRAGYNQYYGFGLGDTAHMGSGAFLRGNLDEVRIWTTARTSEEIRRDMNRRLRGMEPGLISYWHLDEGSGTTARDFTNRGNHGRVQNGAVWVASGASVGETLFIASLHNGQMALRLAGFPNTTYVLQVGTNLIDWLGLTTNRTTSNGLMTFIDSPTEPWKFYRATLP